MGGIGSITHLLQAFTNFLGHPSSWKYLHYSVLALQATGEVVQTKVELQDDSIMPWDNVYVMLTRWWFRLQYFLFSPLLGEDSHFDYYFSKGLKPPTS